MKIDLATSLPQADPWLKYMGLFADDPTFDDFTAEIAAYRQEIDTATIAPNHPTKPNTQVTSSLESFGDNTPE